MANNLEQLRYDLDAVNGIYVGLDLQASVEICADNFSFKKWISKIVNFWNFL